MIIISIKQEKNRKYNHCKEVETVILYLDINIKYLYIRIQINFAKQ